MSETNEYDPYASGDMAPPAPGTPPRYSPVQPAGDYDPYASGAMGVRRDSSGYPDMIPGPVTQTAYQQLPTKETRGVPQDPAVQRIRGAMKEAWDNANVFTPEYQERMNRSGIGGGWLNRNIINPALNTAAAIPAAGGAMVGSTIAELTREAGAPGLGRDINAAIAAASPVAAAMAPVLPRTLTPRREAPQPVERPIPTTPGNYAGPVSKDALAAMEARRGERSATMNATPNGVPGPEGPVSETAFPATVRGAVPGADREVRAPVLGPMPPPPGYVPDVKPQTIAKDAFEVSGAHYDLADHLGGRVSAKANDAFLDNRVAKIRTQTAEARRFDPNDAVDASIVDLNNALRGHDLSLRGTQEIDKKIGDRIEVALRAGKKDEASRLLEMQHALRDHVESVGEAETTGGPAGFAALKDARKAWAIAVRMQDIERMIEKAEGTLNPQQSMRTQVNAYVNNPKMSRGWSTEDLEALKKTTRTGNGVEILRTLSSRLAPIGGYAIAGPLGAAAAITDTLLANQVRGALTGAHRKRLEDVTQRLSAHLPGMPGSEIGPPAPPPGILMTTGQGLPQPSQRGLLGSMAFGTDPGELRRQAEQRAALEEQLRLRREAQVRPPVQW